MTGVLFLSQPQLDTWLDGGQVDMGQETLIFTGDRREFPMVPAVRFVTLAAGEDRHKLLGKAKAIEALRMGGADVSLGTVVMANEAYEVEEGFMLTVPMTERAARLPTSPAGSAIRPATAKPTGKEADLLAQFILDKLS